MLFFFLILFPYCQCCRSGSDRIGIILADSCACQPNAKLNYIFWKLHYTVQNIENYDFCVTLTWKINQCLLALLWIKSKKNSTYMHVKLKAVSASKWKSGQNPDRHQNCITAFCPSYSFLKSTKVPVNSCVLNTTFTFVFPYVVILILFAVISLPSWNPLTWRYWKMITTDTEFYVETLVEKQQPKHHFSRNFHVFLLYFEAVQRLSFDCLSYRFRFQIFFSKLCYGPIVISSLK